jgi:hypothetical protein
MATDNEKKALDYGAFLADLEAKRSALDQAIASLRAVMAAGTTEGMSSINMAVTLANPAIHNGEIPAGAFLGKSIPEAAKLYLSIVRAKQTTREIAEAMLKGGMETTSSNFENIVGAGIHRASKKDGEIVKVGRAWALAAWYPSGIRAAAAKETRKARKAKKSRKQKSVKASATTAAPAGGVLAKDGHIRFPREAPIETNGHKTTQERIADLLRTNPSSVYTPQEVSKALNIGARFAALTLGKLAAKKLADKVESGKYRAAHG